MKACMLVVVSVIALAAVTGAASAATGVPLTVKGTQTIVDEKQGRFTLHGDLVGSWNTMAFTLHYAGADGQVVGGGKELFTGCADSNRNGACDAGEPKGTLRFTFIFWSQYKPGTETLVRGQCVHPIVGGTGAFAKAKGVLHFVDRPSGSGVKTTYRGTVELAKAPSAARTEQASTRASRTSSATRSSRGACGS